MLCVIFFFSSRRRHTRFDCDWSSDVCSSDLSSEYEIYGHSFLATIQKSDQRFIGQCGLLTQEVDGQPEVELGYVLAPQYWQRGLALEGTQALKDYGLQQLGFPRLISLIPPENVASIHIAEKIGMQYERDVDQWGQHFRLYAVKQPERTNN